MKNLIITGPSRAGKTTLAQELSKQLGYNMISLDDLVDGLSNISDIKEQFDDGFEEITDNLAPFLVRFLKQITLGTTYAHGIRYVVEGSYFNFDALMPEIAKLSDQYEVIGGRNNKLRCPFSSKCEFEINYDNDNYDFILEQLLTYDLFLEKDANKKFALGLDRFKTIY
jgi:AAA+ ATPase superfamily predicted ATPase